MTRRNQGLHLELEERLKFERLIADLSSNFINLRPSEVDREIEDAQRRVCETLGLELSALWQWSVEDPSLLILTHLHSPPGGPARPERIDARQAFPWALERLLRGETLVISTDELPPEAAIDIESRRFFGITSSLNLPLSAGGGPILGVLSFDALSTDVEWPAEIVNRLQLIAQVFANALERKRADQLLRASEERLTMAAESAGAGLWSLDLTDMRFWLLPNTKETFGFGRNEVVTFERFQEVVHPDDRELTERTLSQLLRSHDEMSIEYRIRRPDGSIRWLSSRGRRRPSAPGSPEVIMGVSVDITPRREAELEAQRSRAEIAQLLREAMLGELAGALSHELNQPLTAIMCNAQAAKNFIDGEKHDLEELRAIMDEIVQDDARAGEVIRRLRLLLKKGKSSFGLVNLNDVVDDVVRLARFDLLEPGTKLEVRLAPDLPKIEGNPQQLQQALLNLVINASEAMAQSPSAERRILIRTELRDGESIVVSVTDRGTGIGSEAQEKMFDSFFTTRLNGLGVGLAITRSIVAAHSGLLAGENNRAGGATFTMTFRAHRAQKA